MCEVCDVCTYLFGRVVDVSAEERKEILEYNMAQSVLQNHTQSLRERERDRERSRKRRKEVRSVSCTHQRDRGGGGGGRGKIKVHVAHLYDGHSDVV